MVWDYAIVAFLDVLGFAAFVESDAQTQTPRNLDRLLSALGEARKVTPAGGLDVRSFSDSIVLSATLSLTSVLDCIAAVRGLQRILIDRGILVRGGVAFGKHFSDADSIYSEALVAAYRLERDHARFPRIVVQADLLDWFFNDVRTTTEARESVKNLLLHDRDDRLFIHYLDKSSLKPHFELLTAYEGQRLTASVLEKVQWLASYHNYVAAQCDVALSVSGRLVEGFRAL